jgi:demethylmenaquinone methyltransferase/2-methoxy-6-polyprenyl-1,4-benzoquinol methylase
MRRGRRAYYDVVSRFYDGFVALHSRDTQGVARKFLVDRVPVQNGSSVLDLCTGTGTLLTHLQAKVGPNGQVVGVDFSPGMLKVAREKTTSFANVCFVEADAGRLPFADGTFDAVTCSHAFYELKGETQERALQEIVRVLRPSGAFLMMEHDVPSNPFVRALFTSASPLSAAAELLPSFATSRRCWSGTSRASRKSWLRPDALKS